MIYTIEQARKLFLLAESSQSGPWQEMKVDPIITELGITSYLDFILQVPYAATVLARSYCEEGS